MGVAFPVSQDVRYLVSISNDIVSDERTTRLRFSSTWDKRLAINCSVIGQNMLLSLR